MTVERPPARCVNRWGQSSSTRVWPVDEIEAVQREGDGPLTNRVLKQDPNGKGAQPLAVHISAGRDETSAHLGAAHLVLSGEVFA